MELTQFIDKIACIKTTDICFNQYSQNQQKHNLFQYLKFRLENNAKTLFLGEAAGYLGCRYSGIPFTSGLILSSHPLYAKIRNQYQFAGIEKENEKSANCVYEFFTEYPIAFEKSVLWNAFPFHPHLKASEKVKNPTETNRSPDSDELRLGLFLLIDLIEIFHFSAIYPIGNKAKTTIENLKKRGYFPRQAITKIRHPAYGGKNEFLSTIKQIWVNLENKKD